jgi:hypothetical protein
LWDLYGIKVDDLFLTPQGRALIPPRILAKVRSCLQDCNWRIVEIIEETKCFAFKWNGLRGGKGEYQV